MKKGEILFIVIGIIFSLILLSNSTISNEKDYWLDYIISNFNRFNTVRPLQKVYLHLNSEKCNAGSTLWYKAYVINSKEQLPDTISRNLYVEIIAPDKRVIMEQLLKLDNGFAYGDFPIHDTMSTGNYQIRAYTNNMKNFGAEFLFFEDFIINKPEKVFYTKELHRTAKKKKRQKEEVDLQFFPEGGRFVDGIKSRLGFKAINSLGLGSDVEGDIFNKKGKKIAHFKSSHLGMGSIEIIPHHNETYYAILSQPSGIRRKYTLPKVLEFGYSLNIEQHNDSLSINIETNKIFISDKTARSIYLIGQNGGKIYYEARHVFNTNKINIKLPESIFPTGVAHFTLFDGHAKPQCERLVFINHKDFLNIQFNKNFTESSNSKTIDAHIKVTDNNGKPVKANLSMVVRKKINNKYFYDTKRNIKNYLLLQADLYGNIENPEYYFTNTDNASKAADVLMLTQGWRKFSWQEILSDSLYSPEFKIIRDLRITGRITKNIFNLKSKESIVTLTFLNKYNDVYKCNTGNSGRFEFVNLDYSDTLDVLIEARSRSNNKNIMIILDKEKDFYPIFNPFKGFYIDSLLVKRNMLYVSPKEEDDPNQLKLFRPYGEADQVVKFNNSNYSGFSNVLDALRGRVPGLNVGKNSATIRGNKNYGYSNEPLYLIDGVMVDREAVLSVNVEDVDRVEILKGSSASIYGSKGGNGVIAVYTKRGHFFKRGELRFKMLGYHTPGKFYTPKYKVDNLSDMVKSNLSTIYWNPIILTNEKGRASVSFYQPNIPGEYEVVIEGISFFGKVGTLGTHYTLN